MFSYVTFTRFTRASIEKIATERLNAFDLDAFGGVVVRDEGVC